MAKENQPVARTDAPTEAAEEKDNLGDPGPAKKPQPRSEIKTPASGFSRAWLIQHPIHGGRRIVADTKEEAIAEYKRKRCPALTPESEKLLTVQEVPFVPAATEAEKPGGWLKPEQVKAMREKRKKNRNLQPA